MPIEHHTRRITVDAWPGWFLSCFLAADAFARRKNFFAYSRAAYLQHGRGDLIIASRAGSAAPADWTADGERASFFFLGSTLPTDKKDWEYAGVGWRGANECSLFWLSYFIENRKTLHKEGEGFRYAWGQAGDQGTQANDLASRLQLLQQVERLPPPAASFG